MAGPVARLIGMKKIKNIGKILKNFRELFTFSN